MTKTLLDIVQDLTSSISGDTINSIFDTVESEQIARIVRDCYEYLYPTLEVPETYTLFELESSGDSSKPTVMTKPSTVQTIEWLKYDSRVVGDTNSKYQELRYIPLQDFIEQMYRLPLGTSTSVSSFTTTINNASVEVWYENDKAPEYYTSYDNGTLLFDSINSALENTLVKTKTLGYGKLSSNFVLTDTWVPPFDEAGVALLYQDAKTQAFQELRLMENPISAKKGKALKIKETMPSHKGTYVGYGRNRSK